MRRLRAAERVALGKREKTRRELEAGALAARRGGGGDSDAGQPEVGGSRVLRDSAAAQALRIAVGSAGGSWPSVGVARTGGAAVGSLEVLEGCTTRAGGAPSNVCLREIATSAARRWADTTRHAGRHLSHHHSRSRR